MNIVSAFLAFSSYIFLNNVCKGIDLLEGDG